MSPPRTRRTLLAAGRPSAEASRPRAGSCVEAMTRQGCQPCRPGQALRWRPGRDSAFAAPSRWSFTGAVRRRRRDARRTSGSDWHTPKARGPSNRIPSTDATSPPLAEGQLKAPSEAGGAKRRFPYSSARVTPAGVGAFVICPNRRCADIRPRERATVVGLPPVARHGRCDLRGWAGGRSAGSVRRSTDRHPSGRRAGRDEFWSTTVHAPSSRRSFLYLPDVGRRGARP
jgi:hypothetical protein